jgi:DNA recombination protein RmuC
VDLTLTLAIALAVAGVAAGLAAALLWRGRRAGADAARQDRIDRLEATLRENLRESLGASADTVVARMGERFEVKHRELSEASHEQLRNQEREVRGAIAQLKADTEKTLGDLRVALGEAVADGTRKTAFSLQETMKLATDTLNQRFAQLQTLTDGKLTEISGKVSERLDEGFKKTQQTFVDVVQRLTIIDQAQKKIAELSKEVVSLQDILSDKKSRGVFGEVQLHQLVMNVLPEGAYALQHDLGEGRRADCVLFLPPPTGTVAVDAKFPLENYRRMFDPALSEAERQGAARLFKQDVKAHVDAIAAKYIIPGRTSDGAFMFVPAEAVFAEIHAHHPDLVELANRKRVFITSPTTMMAVLTTARAVLKDARTREQVHIIQTHLVALAQDFDRFQRRMDDLARHIRQAHDDVEKVGTSARKITSRFEKIERVQLEDRPGPEPVGESEPAPEARPPVPPPPAPPA